MVTCCITGAVREPPTSSPTSRHVSDSSSPLSVWQAATHALQPEQRSRSTSKAYCCPGPGGVAGSSERYRGESSRAGVPSDSLAAVPAAEPLDGGERLLLVEQLATSAGR